MSELSNDISARVTKIIHKEAAKRAKSAAQAQTDRARKNRGARLAKRADVQIATLTKELATARADAERDGIARKLVFARLRKLAGTPGALRE
jgi:hypothetical protein